MTWPYWSPRHSHSCEWLLDCVQPNGLVFIFIFFFWGGTLTVLKSHQNQTQQLSGTSGLHPKMIWVFARLAPLIPVCSIWLQWYNGRVGTFSFQGQGMKALTSQVFTHFSLRLRPYGIHFHANLEQSARNLRSNYRVFVVIGIIWFGNARILKILIIEPWMRQGQNSWWGFGTILAKCRHAYSICVGMYVNVYIYIILKIYKNR